MSEQWPQFPLPVVFLFQTVAKARLRRRQHKVVNRAIMEATEHSWPAPSLLLSTQSKKPSCFCAFLKGLLTIQCSLKRQPKKLNMASFLHLSLLAFLPFYTCSSFTICIQVLLSHHWGKKDLPVALCHWKSFDCFLRERSSSHQYSTLHGTVLCLLLGLDPNESKIKGEKKKKEKKTNYMFQYKMPDVCCCLFTYSFFGELHPFLCTSSATGAA